MAFKYRERTAADMEKRATGGGDFTGIFKGDFKTFTVKEGENAIRIFPPTWGTDEDPPKHYGFDVWVHYQIGPQNQQVLCLAKTFNKPCPICEAKMRGEGGEKEQGKKHPLAPTRRVAMWLMDATEPDKGPMIATLAQTLDTDIVKVSKDRETGQYYLLDHPTEGYTVYFNRSGTAMLTKYDGLALARRPSSIPQPMLDYVEKHPIPDCIVVPTYEDVLAIYEGGVPGESSAKEAEDEPRTSGRERPSWDNDGRHPDHKDLGTEPAKGGWTAPTEEPPPPAGEADYGGQAEPTPRAKPKLNPEPEPPKASTDTKNTAQSLKERFAAKKAAAGGK